MWFSYISIVMTSPKGDIHMNSNFNYNTYKVDFEFFVYFIGPVVSIIAIMAAVILVHPEWVKRPKLAHADRPQIEIKK